MPHSANTHYDVASAINIGQRDCQEDAIITDFPLGAQHGFVVLADGMGGHAAGDIASKIVVTEVFSELKLQSGDSEALEGDINRILRGAAGIANQCVQSHAASHPLTNGMGATLLASVLLKNHLYWISVGDSPLYLFRAGQLTQLNEDHSLAPQIDHMVRSGLMKPENGRDHPDRNCLTSVLVGLEIPQVDCPSEPLALQPGDIIVAASDGLQFLSDEQICDVLSRHENSASAEITSALIRNVEHLNDPDQDNVSISVIKINRDVHARSERKPRVNSSEIPAGVRRKNEKRNKVSVVASKTKSGVAMAYRVSLSPGRMV